MSFRGRNHEFELHQGRARNRSPRVSPSTIPHVSKSLFLSKGAFKGPNKFIDGIFNDLNLVKELFDYYCPCDNCTRNLEIQNYTWELDTFIPYHFGSRGKFIGPVKWIRRFECEETKFCPNDNCNVDIDIFYEHHCDNHCLITLDAFKATVNFGSDNRYEIYPININVCRQCQFYGPE